MDKWNWKTWATLVVVIVVGLGATLGVIYGVATHEEAGLLTACDGPRGALDYNGYCFEVEWDPEQFPLRVYVTGDRALVGAASEAINARLGFEALRLDQGAMPDIFVETGTLPPEGSRPGGGTLHWRVNGRLSAEVRTWNTATDGFTYWTLYHELGHALGLAHDDFPMSVMFPVVSDPEDLRNAPRLTDSDRTLLRDLYAP